MNTMETKYLIFYAVLFFFLLFLFDREHFIFFYPITFCQLSRHGSRNVRAHGPPTSPECEFCHGRLLLGGPFYSQPIHDLEFVQSILCSLDNPENGALKTEKRIRGVLRLFFFFSSMRAYSFTNFDVYN
jgi:tRNA G26 N,N-dimethylase Trm1